MITLLVICALVAAALAILRFVLGPSDADRIVALDILFAVGIALCGAAALYTGRLLYLDVAIGVALIGFIATLAWARVVERMPGEIPLEAPENGAADDFTERTP